MTTFVFTFGWENRMPSNGLWLRVHKSTVLFLATLFLVFPVAWDFSLALLCDTGKCVVSEIICDGLKD